MKTSKYIAGGGKCFCYGDSKTGILHGLCNDLKSVFPIGIGYYYKDKNKGFWLHKQ